MLVIALAIMAILMGVAVQAVSFAARREREAELVFRGQQYVEAIRLYKTKYGRYPTQLKELWEAKPRVIRKKWKDPMTDSESWGLVFLGQEGRELAGPGARAGGAGGRGQGSPQPTPTATPPAGEGSGGGFGNPSGEKIGPIIGVHSTSCEESIRIYDGRTRYCDWKFVFDEKRGQQGGRGTGPQPTPNLPFGTRDPGRSASPTPRDQAPSDGWGNRPGRNRPRLPTPTPGR